MTEGRPSRTAQRVAVRRAAHQVVDRPLIFEDPFALRIIGPDAAASTQAKADGKVSSSFRAFMAVRSRYAEDELRAAVARGVRQYVVLGAGLDTFAWRNPWPDVRVFEVDHPATQHWKKQRVALASMGHPEGLTYTPTDFEHKSISEGLEAAGFDSAAAACVTWLGVSMYLTPEAFDTTAGFVASLRAGSALTFDYAVERASLGFFERQALDHLSRKVESLGEPLRLFFSPDELAERMRRMGFHDIEDMGSDDLNGRYLAGRSDGLKLRGGIGRIMRVRK